MNHDLLDIATDQDVVRVRDMVRAVRRDEHKMQAFVRFREIGRERDTHFVAGSSPSIISSNSPLRFSCGVSQT